MLTNSLERRKRELLNRVAGERMLALESAGSVCHSAKVGMGAIRGSGRFLRYISLAATGLVAAGICTFAAKSMQPRRKALPQRPVKSEFFRPLLLQGITLVLFPYLRNLLTASRRTPDFSRYSPGRLFFRWLGLER